MASLIVANAMIFQEHLSSANPSVSPLARLLDEDDFVFALAEHWRYIIENIDYVPIFDLARRIVVSYPANAEIDQAMRTLARTARAIVNRRAALRHDLAGRIYHRLLAEAKYLGTYYTSVPAATLLLRLALRPEAWNIDWSDPASVGSLRIADLASGTGTLLMAAIQAATDNHVRESCRRGTHSNPPLLHKLMIENVIHGYDVLSSAAHLTATTVAFLAPEVSFDNMHIWVLSLGGPENHLGSIDLLSGRADFESGDPLARTLPAQISLTAETGEFQIDATTRQRRVTGTGHADAVASFPSLDLCVMNPPFTRSVGGNLLFGSLPSSERQGAQKKLGKLLARSGILANSTAGLGAVFVAAAHKILKPRGRMALVLPRALASGIAWKETRELFGQDYVVEYLIVSHDPARWNFSENTDLSETLVVARKEPESDTRYSARTICLNLWRNPRTIVEALALADSVLGCVPARVEDEGVCRVQTDGTIWGEAISVPWNELGSKEWSPFFFAQTDVARAAYHLLRGEVFLPGQGLVASFPVCALESLGMLGPDCRDIHDGFEASTAQTAYPAFWGHDCTTVATLEQMPNRFLVPRSRALPGRHLRRPSLLWPRAGRVLIAERLWFNTQRLTSVLVREPVLSNVWWPFKPNEAIPPEVLVLIEKALVLWLNSTYGLAQLLALREETRGAWCKFKKPLLNKLPVPRFIEMPRDSLVLLAAAFEELRGMKLKPLPALHSDPVRARIDRAMAEALGMPDPVRLRHLLAREPIISLRPFHSPE